MTIGARIRARRSERGLSQEALAHIAGVSIATVSRAERGLHAPQLHNLRAIAAALDCDPADLIDPERAA